MPAISSPLLHARAFDVSTVRISALSVGNLTRHAVPDCLVLVVQTRREWDAAPDEAEDLLKPAAMTEQVGIPVTRLAPDYYEKRLNNNVPRA
ncbi:hypothetical protein [Arthrobacter sp. NicSoilB8]|uniref:hypothetical protein n=1 Tax=Arthrobacter sp. NicSoilB8 TaxID=2830998 RepID=UPI001CC4E3A7|nr:hypothetical protein [Arthrobacter sp. NicSoilB8]BCW73619.1 hypothetical protein NicSoilB8_46630 [Arthrobacter sp. NicSoilB8]